MNSAGHLLFAGRGCTARSTGAISALQRCSSEREQACLLLTSRCARLPAALRPTKPAQPWHCSAPQASSGTPGKGGRRARARVRL